MKKTLSVMLGLLIVTALFNFPAAAYYPKSGCGMKNCDMNRGGQWGIKEKFFHKANKVLGYKEELALSSEQETQIENLMKETKKNLIRKKAEIKVLALDIQDLLKDNPVNVAEINGLIDRKYEIKKEKTKELVAAYAQLKGILSQGQWGTLKDLWKKSKAA